MAQEKIQTMITQEEQGKRIDAILAERFPQFSRSYIKKMILNGDITVQDKNISPSYKTKLNDELQIIVPEPVDLDIKPEKMDLDIVYEDDDIILINKPKGVVVHPSCGHDSGTIVNGLLWHCKDNLSRINGVMRPGIVHRIDKDTTGLIIACKNDNAHRFIAEQLAAHSIERTYEAIVYHHFNVEEGTIEGSIGRHPNDRKKMAMNVPHGKPAITHYNVIRNLDKNFAYISCKLETGRTHQIRVHMTSINHPLLGDEVYGPKKCPYNLQGQTLHAKTLGFVHPTTHEFMQFSVPLPQYFENLLRIL